MAQPHIHVNILANNDINREKEIFQRISLGDETAFTYIFNHYADTLYTHAFRLLKSEFWAEETVQEVFVKLWADRSALTSIQSPGAYLFRMVVNKSLDRIRQHQAEIKKQYIIVRRSQQTPPKEDDTDDNLNKIDQLLVDTIAQLPAQRKLIYQLKYWQGLSYDQIASQLNISKHTVRNQLSSALASIRAALSKNSNFLSYAPVFLHLFLQSGEIR